MLKKLTILATTDVHSNIWGYNYEKNEEMKEGGMTNLFTYIQKVRHSNPNTILLDNGDIIQGTLLTDELYNRGWTGEHPIAKIMNFMEYHAMTLGNHEFNFGLNMLKKFEDEVDFPILSANTIDEISGNNFVKPYTIIEKDKIRIGIIGLTTPMVPLWGGNKVKGLKFNSLAETAKKYVEEISKDVDVIIVMAHSSLDGEVDYDKDAARRIIEMCPQVDVLIVGHFHITVKEMFNNTIIGGATDKGREIIRFDLQIDENKRIVNKSVEIIDMKDYSPSQEIREIPLVKEAHNRTIELAHGNILGKALKDFQPVNEINYIPQGRLEETPLIQLINKVQLLNCNADVSSTSLIREGSNIYKGNITYGTICSIYKFDTELYVVEVTGAQLKAYMEWCASAYNKQNEGDISISFSRDIPSYQHDMFSGINYNIDLTKDIGNRIIDLKFKGRELRDHEIVKLAISDYSYYTTLKGRGFTEKEPIWTSKKLIKEMIADYVKSKAFIEPELDGNWRLVGCNLNHPLRKDIIKKVNEGNLDIPYNKSLNLYELQEAGII